MEESPLTPQSKYDVFLSHSHIDAEIVNQLAKRLEDHVELNVWLDKWILVPGEKWQQEIAKGLKEAKTCAVCIGGETPSGWCQEEIELALDRQVADPTFRVIPVLLPGAREVNVENFLKLRTWIKFKKEIQSDDVFYEFVCGILGLRPGRNPFKTVMKHNAIRMVQKNLQVIHELEKYLHPDVVMEYQRRELDKIIG